MRCKPNQTNNAKFQGVFTRQGLNVGTAYCLASYSTKFYGLYKATASGVIAPGIDPSTGDGNLVDQWYLAVAAKGFGGPPIVYDSLINFQDGVQ